VIDTRGTSPTAPVPAWLPRIDLDGRRAVVHREPQGDGYQERVEVAANEALVSTALTLPPLQVTDALDAE